MALSISSSAYYLKIGDRVIDKITEEYNPPSYWFRLKISAKGKAHQQCLGHIKNLWHRSGRRVSGFDPLTMFWLSEPLKPQERTDNIVQQYYKPDIASGNYELAGLMHVKLPLKPQDPNLPLPAENIPDEQLPEVRIDQSANEPRHTSKRRTFPYGVYYVQVVVADGNGEKGKKTFKVWAFREAARCKIRSSRFYERLLLLFKALFPAV